MRYGFCITIMDGNQHKFFGMIDINKVGWVKYDDYDVMFFDTIDDLKSFVNDNQNFFSQKEVDIVNYEVYIQIIFKEHIKIEANPNNKDKNISEDGYLNKPLKSHFLKNTETNFGFTEDEVEKLNKLDKDMFDHYIMTKRVEMF